MFVRILMQRGIETRLKKVSGAGAFIAFKHLPPARYEIGSAKTILPCVRAAGLIP
jgi:hypothetical protein